jgi:hypothetical protein
MRDLLEETGGDPSEPAGEPAGGSIAVDLVTGARRLHLEAITAVRPNRDGDKGLGPPERA